MRWSCVTGWGVAALVLVAPAGGGPCEEEPDVIDIQGSSLANVGEAVRLSTLAGGVDAGGTATYAWAIVEGAASIFGPADGPAVDILSWDAGLVTIEVTYDDGVCTEGGSISSRFFIDFAFIDAVGKPGDLNQDGLFNLSDPIALLNYLFAGGDSPPPPCGDGSTSHPSNRQLLDLNGDGSIDVSDAVYGLNFLFSGGRRPVNCLDDSCPCFLVPDCEIAIAGDCGA